MSGERPGASSLVIGVGNDNRGDDRVGLIVARRLRDLIGSAADVIERDRDGASLMEDWVGRESVIVIDAVISGAEPGTILRFEAHAERLPYGYFHHSTHAFGLAEAVELTRALREMPPRFIVFGVEGENFTLGAEMSTAVELAADYLPNLCLVDLRLNCERGS